MWTGCMRMDAFARGHVEGQVGGQQHLTRQGFERPSTSSVAEQAAAISDAADCRPRLMHECLHLAQEVAWSHKMPSELLEALSECAH